jgi:hypothetical protein
MKKFPLLFICLLFIYFPSFSNDPFQSIDYPSEFKKLEKIEKFIENNPNYTLSELAEKQPDLIAEIRFSDQTSTSFLESDDPGGFPPFWWGFCLGVWGILLVFLLTDKDKAAVNLAVKGCMTSTLVGLGVYLIFFIIALSQA